MIDFDKPLVAENPEIAGIEFRGKYINNGSTCGVVVVKYKNGNERLASLGEEGIAFLMNGLIDDFLVVHNAPRVERIRKYYMLKDGCLLSVHDSLFPVPHGYELGKFVFVLTDGRVTAIEMVK